MSEKIVDLRGGKRLESCPYLPILNQVVIKESSDLKKIGLLFVADKKVDYVRGTIVAIGPGAIDNNGGRIPMQFQIGDSVIVNKMGKFSIENYVVVSELDIKALEVTVDKPVLATFDGCAQITVE